MMMGRTIMSCHSFQPLFLIHLLQLQVLAFKPTSTSPEFLYKSTHVLTHLFLCLLPVFLPPLLLPPPHDPRRRTPSRLHSSAPPSPATLTSLHPPPSPLLAYNLSLLSIPRRPQNS